MPAERGDPFLGRSSFAERRPRRERTAPSGDDDRISGEADVPGAGLHPPVQHPVEQKRAGGGEIETPRQPARRPTLSPQEEGSRRDVSRIPPEALRSEVVRCPFACDQAGAGGELPPVPLHRPQREGESVPGVHPPAKLPAPARRAHDLDSLLPGRAGPRFGRAGGRGHREPLRGHRMAVLEPRESDLAKRRAEPAGERAGRERRRASGLAHQKPVVRPGSLRLEAEVLFHHEIAWLAPEYPGNGRRPPGEGQIGERNESAEAFPGPVHQPPVGRPALHTPRGRRTFHRRTTPPRRRRAGPPRGRRCPRPGR